MIFCYKFGTFAEFWNFCLAKYGGRLIHGYSKTCIFGAKKQGVDLYTDSTYTPENTVPPQMALNIYTDQKIKKMCKPPPLPPKKIINSQNFKVFLDKHEKL